MLKGLGQLGDMAKLMRQAQDMQTKMVDVQAHLENLEVIGEAGGGLIKATVNAKGSIKGIAIDQSLFKPSGTSAAALCIIRWYFSNVSISPPS